MGGKRTIPFGYRMREGKMEIDWEEAELVRRIFQGYALGKTMLELAAELESMGISYREGMGKWNKNMVFRILEDKRYMGTDGYPAVIDREEFDAADTRRREKRRKSSALLPREIQDRLCCPQCGKGLCRAAWNQGRVTWGCSACGWASGWIEDREILRQVILKLNKVLAQPELALVQRKEQDPYSSKAMRLTHEINRKLGDPDADPKELLNRIKACAQEKYSSLGIGHWADNRLKSSLKQHQPSEAFNAALFQEIVSKVLMMSETKISLQLINQVVI